MSVLLPEELLNLSVRDVVEIAATERQGMLAHWVRLDDESGESSAFVMVITAQGRRASNALISRSAEVVDYVKSQD